MMKKKKKKNSFKITKRHRDIAFVLIFIFCLIVKMCSNHLELKELRENGVLTVAHVYKKTHNRYTHLMWYEFEVDGRRYTGHTDGHETKVGKLIFVVYLPSDPSINASNRVVGLKEPYE